MMMTILSCNIFIFNQLEMSYSMRMKQRAPSECSVDAVGNTRRKVPGYRRPKSPLVGYTGYNTKNESATDDHVLEVPLKKIVIRGYSGFRPNSQELFGVPRIPSIASQMRPQAEEENEEEFCK